MRHWNWPTLVLAALLATLAGMPPSRADDALARGRDMATRLCAACHMSPGQGEKMGGAGVPGFAAVAQRPGQSIDGIVAWLRSTPPMMPNHHLTQDEMFLIAGFILSLRDAKP